MIFDVVLVVTGLVPTVKVTVEAPAGTVTELGTVATFALLVRVTLSPPLGARPVSDTVPMLVPPPPT